MLAPLNFSKKEFEILDLDPPINATSHYDACHFRYNLALMYTFQAMSQNKSNAGFDDALLKQVKCSWNLDTMPVMK